MAVSTCSFAIAVDPAARQTSPTKRVRNTRAKIRSSLQSCDVIITPAKEQQYAI
jgi:hypothetical protein